MYVDEFQALVVFSMGNGDNFSISLETATHTRTEIPQKSQMELGYTCNDIIYIYFNAQKPFNMLILPISSALKSIKILRAQVFGKS